MHSRDYKSRASTSTELRERVREKGRVTDCQTKINRLPFILTSLNVGGEVCQKRVVGRTKFVTFSSVLLISKITSLASEGGGSAHGATVAQNH